MNIQPRYYLVVLMSLCCLVNADEGPLTDAVYEQLMAEICAANTEPVKRQTTQVFSWTDENGQVHFGDRPPQTVDAQVETLTGQRDYFDLTIVFADGPNQPGLANSLEVNGRAIAQVMGRLVPEGQMTKSDVQMHVFVSHSGFRAYQRQKAPELSAQTVGFYSALDNSVAVWHSQNPDMTREIALHEATHVFQVRNMGMLPAWLVEGMASYFEKLTVSGQSKQVVVSDQWLGWFRYSGQVLSVEDLLVAEYRHWQGPQGPAYYAGSWALVYYLMQPEYRAIMEQYLTLVSTEKCDDTSPAETLAFFEQAYPGGIAKLQSDLLSWLAGPHRVPNYH